jgi:hypothetical protein
MRRESVFKTYPRVTARGGIGTKGRRKAPPKTLAGAVHIPDGSDYELKVIE